MERMKRWATGRDRGGINRLVALLLLLVAVMLVIIAMPKWNAFRFHSETTACEQAIKSARDGLIIDYLTHYDTGTEADALATLEEVMPARANICPAGGTVYLVRGSDGVFEPICGLHDADERRRCRLNANRVRELLSDSLTKARKGSDETPDKVSVGLNGKVLECVRVDEIPGLHRGTATSTGYDGVVAFYGIAGEGTFSTKGVKAGKLCWFIYADENYCAIWSVQNGWSGDAYSS